MNLSEVLVNLGLRTGPVQTADGNLISLRGGKTGEGIVAQAHGKYYEAASRGNLFSAYYTGHAMTAVNTTCVGMLLWNPTDSGKNLVLGQYVISNHVTSTGPLGLGLAYSVQAIVPSTVTTVATVQMPTKLGPLGSTGNSVAKAYIAATLLVTPTIFQYLGRVAVAIATTGQGDQIQGDFDGSVIVPPGYIIAVQSVIAVAAAAAIFGHLTWEEVPII